MLVQAKVKQEAVNQAEARLRMRLHAEYAVHQQAKDAAVEALQARWHLALLEESAALSVMLGGTSCLKLT